MRERSRHITYVVHARISRRDVHGLGIHVNERPPGTELYVRSRNGAQGNRTCQPGFDVPQIFPRFSLDFPQRGGVTYRQRKRGSLGEIASG
jgi:hypothetical protein